MPAISFAVPLLPDRTEAARVAMTSCGDGARRADHERSRRRLGIRREAVWLQPTPEGDLAVVYMEADDVPRALIGLATSDEPFDRWFREHVREVHGIDLADGFPPPEPLLDFRT